MNISSHEDVDRQSAAARDTYREASTEGYLKTVGMAGRAVIPAGSGCAKAVPANDLVNELAASLRKTRSRARALAEGRNVFGFDITFTPARPFSTGVSACGSTGKGLQEEATCAAQRAEAIQQQMEFAERNYDLNQIALIQQVNQLNTTLNTNIALAGGCTLQGSDSQTFFTCSDEQIALVSSCDPRNDITFNACIGRSQIKSSSSLTSARRDMRAAWLALQQAKTIHDNFIERADIERFRNITVNDEILTGAMDEAATEAIIIAANCCSVTVGTETSYTVNPGAFVEASLRPALILRKVANEMKINDVESEAVLRNLFLDMAEARYQIDMAFQQYRTAEATYDTIAGQLEADLFEAKRQQAYLVASPANDPAYRMVRDSKRLELATALEDANRLAYLAARRAEYEYTARLSGSGFRISDVYKARTANDTLKFLTDLGQTVAALPGAIKDAEIDDEDFTISIARHVLGLTDAYLAEEGFAGPDIEAERLLRLRRWAETHKTTDSGGEEIISFNFTTTSNTKGILSQVKQQGYDTYWLHKLTGIGQPFADNSGTGINLVTGQAGVGPRQAELRQSGQVELTSFAGCLFTYRLMPDAVMLGLDWPSNQPTENVIGVLQTGINGQGGDPARRFLGRPVAANWEVKIFTAGPDSTLDVQQLEDIELEFSTTYATRESSSPPTALDCVRADF